MELFQGTWPAPPLPQPAAGGGSPPGLVRSFFQVLASLGLKLGLVGLAVSPELLGLLHHAVSLILRPVAPFVVLMI